ncbi:MAG TPA: hypothetical protein VFJ51_02280 [Nitrososphaeraceae archaeon]|nr:hypothetical protein [Nitrososphaeraceae archaeon]
MLLDVLGVQAMDLGSSKRASYTTNQTGAKIDMGEYIVKHDKVVFLSISRRKQQVWYRSYRWP